MKMKKIAVVLFLVLFICTPACAMKPTERNVLLNYAAASSLVVSGGTFAVVGKGGNEILIFPPGSRDAPFVLAENAVFVCENEHHGGYFLVGADDESFYYLCRSYSGNGYGAGHGARIYRYHLKNGKTELVYRDVALTNFDGFLGLEDMLGLQNPLSNGAVTEMGGFWIKGTAVLTPEDVLQRLKNANEAQNAGVRLSDRLSRFCVSGSSVFFTDAFQNLYLYRMDTDAFKVLPFEAVSMFFVTEENLFVIRSPGADITVCDGYGEYVKTISSDGAVFSNAHCCRTENGALFLQDETGIIWKIDEKLSVSEVFYVDPEIMWTVSGGIVYYYDAGTRSISPAAH